jgi:transposase
MEKTLSSQASNWRKGRRLRAFELKEQGWKQKEIAEALGVTEGAASQWMKRATKQGVEGLRLKPPPGATPRLSEDQRARVPELLAQGAQAHGFWGRGVDVRESGHGNQQGVWSRLSSDSCESFTQSLETQPAKTAAPSESEGRGSHRVLAREAVATAQKRALKEGRTIVFADQSGFYLLCLWWFAPTPRWGGHPFSRRISQEITS